MSPEVQSEGFIESPFSRKQQICVLHRVFPQAVPDATTIGSCRAKVRDAEFDQDNANQLPDFDFAQCSFELRQTSLSDFGAGRIESLE